MAEADQRTGATSPPTPKWTSPPRVAQNVLTAEDACAALDAITHLDLTFVGGAGRWLRCLPAALKWGVTAYDALYALLAQDFDAVLVTADERLHTAVTGVPIRLLGH